MSNTLRTLVMVALISVISLSCRKDGTGPSWDVDILAPILRTSLSLEDLVPDSLILAAPDSALSIAYDGTIFRLSLDTLVEIPDETIQETFVLPFGNIYLQPGEAIPTLGNLQEETKYNLNGVELRLLKIRSGSITFELSSSIQEVVELSYQMPSALKNGVPFSVLEYVAAGTQSSQSTLTRTYDLSGYIIDMTGINQNDVNTIVANFAAIISPSATDSVLLSQGDEFDIKYTFNSIKTEYAEGYFGDYSVSDGYTDTIDLFRNMPSGSLNLDSIGLDLKIENGFGADIQIRIDTLRSINSVTGASATLSHSIIGNTANLTRAINIGDGVNPFTYSQYQLLMNTNNSNVDALVENLPDQFHYAFEVDINPFGNNSGGNDFMYYDSDIRISGDVTIPARFSANGLTIVDTMAFDMGTDPETEHETTITGGYFYLYANNGFPFDARVQLLLYDETFVLLDSLLLPPQNLIAAAPVNTGGKVTAKLESRLDIPIDDDKMQVLEKVKKSVVKVVFTTKPTNDILTIYSDYSVDLKLIGDFTYRAQGN